MQNKIKALIHTTERIYNTRTFLTNDIQVYKTAFVSTRHHNGNRKGTKFDILLFTRDVQLLSVERLGRKSQ